MAFLVFLSALLLPIAIWPTKSGDVSQFATEPVCRLLGWMFLVSHFATKLTNYIVYGMDADAYVQSGKRVKFWTAPCKGSFSHKSHMKHWLMTSLWSRHDVRYLPCPLA